MRFLTKRRVVIFILFLIIPFLFISKESNNVDFKNNPPKNPFPEDIFVENDNKPDICSEIESIYNENEEITIIFNNTRENSLENIIFQTKFLENPLYIDLDSFKIINKNKNKIKFKITLPFLGKFVGNFICTSNSYKAKKYKQIETLNKAQRYFTSKEITLNKENFDNQIEESQIQCFGDSFNDRYCIAKNLYIIQQTFVFYTKSMYAFPNNFVLLSPRNNTNNPFVDRLSFSPIVTNTKPKVNKQKNTVYVHSYSPHKYNHCFYLVEFLFPIFNTIKAVEGSFSSYNREFIAIDQDPFYYPLYSVFSDKNVQSLESLNEDSYLLKTTVLGMKRFWKQSESEPYYYEYAKNDVEGLREITLKRLNIKELEHPNIVSFVTAEKRFDNIVNYISVFNEIKANCQMYEAFLADFRGWSVIDMINLSVKSRIMIGRQSSNLANAFWMKSGSNLVDIVPKGYNCCTLYNDIASFSDITYSLTMDEGSNVHLASEKEQREGLERCYNDENRCQDKECYIRLRRQAFNLRSREWTYFMYEPCNHDPLTY